MIVQQFLRWMKTAPAGERADATSALARAWLHSPLGPADRAAAEAAMIVLLDDPAPQVRAALAHALASSRQAPLPVIHALARDVGDIAAIVLAQSPIIGDGDLADALVDGDWRAQVAVACRTRLSDVIMDMIADIGCEEACLALVENSDCPADADRYRRILDRHGALAGIRSAMLDRSDLPLEIRQAAVASLSNALADLAVARGWLPEERARRVTTEARDRGTVAIAVKADPDELYGLVNHLRRSGQMTVSLMLRALLSGDLGFLEETLADLTGLPLARVSALVASRHATSFAALYAKAGLPPKALPAFRAALDALHEQGFVQSPAGEAHLSRRMVERVLTTVGALADEDVAPLLSLLRRFVVEAARDEARALAETVARNDLIAA